MMGKGACATSGSCGRRYGGFLVKWHCLCFWVSLVLICAIGFPGAAFIAGAFGGGQGQHDFTVTYTPVTEVRICWVCRLMDTGKLRVGDVYTTLGALHVRAVPVWSRVKSCVAVAVEGCRDSRSLKGKNWAPILLRRLGHVDLDRN